MDNIKTKFKLKNEINKETCEKFFLEVNTYLKKNNYEDILIRYYSDKLYIFSIGYVSYCLIDEIEIYYFIDNPEELFLSIFGEKIQLIKKIGETK